MGGETAMSNVGVGEGRVDPATLMILRALAGERGKVIIGGRSYTFSCATTFHLLDERTGFLHVCSDSVSFLKKVLELLRAAKRESCGEGAPGGAPG